MMIILPQSVTGSIIILIVFTLFLEILTQDEYLINKIQRIDSSNRLKPYNCSLSWPNLSLFLVLPINQPEMYKNEWKNVFLHSFFTFYPIEQSQTTITIYMNEKSKHHDRHKSLKHELSSFHEYINKNILKIQISPKPITNDMKNNSNISLKLLMFEADEWVTAEYVGLVETDCFFVTYVDREDLFEGLGLCLTTYKYICI